MKRFLLLCTLLATPLTAAADDYRVVFETRGAFADVRDALVLAIEDQGLKITNTNQIAAMLERTGKDLGAERRVYEQAEQFEFCSAVISRQIMEADPHAIVLCPYSIALYTLPGDATVYLAYRKPPGSGDPALRQALANLERLLSDIIRAAR